jgi:hypothetical protein
MDLRCTIEVINPFLKNNQDRDVGIIVISNVRTQTMGNNAKEFST